MTLLRDAPAIITCPAAPVPTQRAPRHNAATVLIPNQYLQAVTADNDRRDVVGKGDGVGQVLRRCMVKLAHRDAYVAPLHLPPLFRANRIERGTLEIQNALEFGLQPTSGWLVKDRQGPHSPLTNHERVLRSITFSTS